ncbi:MAG TPA: aldo/keto reductase [Caldimonas sp.]|nr:aldo/keto reductase [Caldimonas sp.]
MKQRRIGPLEVSAIGLGCMNLSHAYGAPPSPDVAEKVLLSALDLGVTLFDTAALYGFGANETLLGRVLAPHRSKIVLASKCGMTGVNGVRVIDNRPETLRRSCEESLQRLRTDVIDLYYLHRFDRKGPIEDSVGALADLVRAGKVRAIGLSEVSAATLRRAHAVHPVSALQSEYSLWSRNPEIAGLEACREVGASFVAFSPIARGFLSGRLREVATLDAQDIRRNMPRFQPAAFDANLSLLESFTALADEAGCTPAQLALAWLLAQDASLVPIPGTTRVDHLAENVGAASVALEAGLLARVDATINRHTVKGPRYNATTQAEIDTEEFPA